MYLLFTLPIPLPQMIFETNLTESESCLIMFKDLSVQSSNLFSHLFSKYLLFTKLQNPLELLKFELLSWSPRALLLLDLPASPASFLPRTLDFSNAELFLHVHCAISLCIALALLFDWNLLSDSFLHFLLLT